MMKEKAYVQLNTITIGTKLLLAIFLIDFYPNEIQAYTEHKLIVESTGIGALDSVIYADTLPDGNRLDPDRVYVLRKSTKYILSYEIEWSGYDLRIKAEEGSGERPLILVDDQIGFAGHLFVLRESANLELDGLHLNGRYSDMSMALRIIRINGDCDKVTIDNCVMEEASQSIFRLNADSIKVFVTNSIFNRIGNPTDPSNGRLFDNRGHPIDMLLMYNSMAYNATSRFYRNGSDNALLINGIFDQNTFYGSGEYGHTFGKVENLTFTNNIVANPAFLGETSSSTRFGISLDTFIPGVSAVDISFNNFFIYKAFDNLLPSHRFSGEQVYSVNGDFFDAHVTAAINYAGVGATNIMELLFFTDPPLVPAQFIVASADEFYDNAGAWDFADLTPFTIYSEPGIDRYVTFHDFSYSDTTMSYTAGSQGQPLGAHLNFCNYPRKLELSLDTLMSGSYRALDTLILTGTNMLANSLIFSSGGIIKVNPSLEGLPGKEVLMRTESLLCDKLVKRD
ncbi:MAG: hypothetical protein IPL46_22580 [Saprospiraceae bacterium]|nr:hypothetical protein [Saprospiraceae bacterium]